jgi:ABC-type uncharacterized transport system ATPase subunit
MLVSALPLCWCCWCGVLQSVTGYVDPGEMLALMGPSGAGKSTLMDILAGRKSVGHLTGEVLVNGAPQHKKTFTRQTAYIPQVRRGGGGQAPRHKGRDMAVCQGVNDMPAWQILMLCTWGDL